MSAMVASWTHAGTDEKSVLSGNCQSSGPIQLLEQSYTNTNMPSATPTFYARYDKDNTRQDKTFGGTIDVPKIQYSCMIFLNCRQVEAQSCDDGQDSTLNGMTHSHSSCLKYSNKGAVNRVAAVVKQFSKRWRSTGSTSLSTIDIIKSWVKPETGGETEVYPSWSVDAKVWCEYGDQNDIENHEEKAK